MFIHSLSKVATDLMGRVSDAAEADAVATAIAATRLDPTVGRIGWNGAGLPPFAAKNICNTKLVGGQRRRNADGSRQPDRAEHPGGRGDGSAGPMAKPGLGLVPGPSPFIGEMTDVLTLSSESKGFGALKVTDDVSSAMPNGQARGITGPNGAGKSTLFNLMTGNFVPDAGTITLLGRDVTRLPGLARVWVGVGRSFQISKLFEGLTVFEDLVVAARFGRGLPEAAVTQDCIAILEQTVGAMAADQIMQRGIAMVPEGRRLLPSLSVDENLLIGGQVRCAAGPSNLQAIHAACVGEAAQAA